MHGGLSSRVESGGVSSVLVNSLPRIFGGLARWLSAGIPDREAGISRCALSSFYLILPKTEWQIKFKVLVITFLIAIIVFHTILSPARVTASIT
jgi:hypothetical protein